MNSLGLRLFAVSLLCLLVHLVAGEDSPLQQKVSAVVASSAPPQH